ncbi:MAG: hypothetical protein RBU27_06810 [Bacteroidota bacterium]|jgi:cbb3-type cytochrome oxidase subunit 3|nr:hypothetical protein [Bacteroidota bacterium]
MFKSLLDFSSYESLGAVATVLFFAIFLAVIVLVFRMKTSHVTRMENLPLQNDDESSTATKEQE